MALIRLPRLHRPPQTCPPGTRRVIVRIRHRRYPVKVLCVPVRKRRPGPPYRPV